MTDEDDMGADDGAEDDCLTIDNSFLLMKMMLHLIIDGCLMCGVRLVVMLMRMMMVLLTLTDVRLMVVMMYDDDVSDDA